MKFEGPKSLKQQVEEHYAKVSDDFERKSPLIKIDFLPSNGEKYPIWTNKDITFNHYVDRTMDALLELIDKDDNGYLGKFMHKLSRLASESNLFSYKSNTGGFYSTMDDALYLDAFVVAGSILKAQESSPGQQIVFNSYEKEHPGIFDISKSLDHELVHRDMLTTKAVSDYRNAQIDYYRNKTIRSDRKNHASKENLDLIRSKITSLGLHYADEAIAYCFCDERIAFQQYLTKESPNSVDEFLRCYDKMADLVKTKGRKKALIEVKKVIDTSYNTNKTFPDLFLRLE